MGEELEDIEVQLLLDGIFRYYGCDFRNYAHSSLKRRILQMLPGEGVTSISSLQDKVLHDPRCMSRFVDALSVNTSSMFRDPGFFLAFRNEVIPMLKTYPFVRLWHAGCGRGEEVYSMAILLQEEGMYHRCRIYATDISTTSLQAAKDGIFPLPEMQEYTRNYIQSGGRESFSDYYVVQYDHAIFSPSLKRNVLFAQHNLVTDTVFNEFHAIVCRNVLIYFDKSLQRQVHRLFYQSLVTLGFFGVGRTETISFSPHELQYKEISGEHKIYQKVR